MSLNLMNYICNWWDKTVADQEFWKEAPAWIQKEGGVKSSYLLIPVQVLRKKTSEPPWARTKTSTRARKNRIKDNTVHHITYGYYCDKFPDRNSCPVEQAYEFWNSF